VQQKKRERNGGSLSGHGVWVKLSEVFTEFPCEILHSDAFSNGKYVPVLDYGFTERTAASQNINFYFVNR
jgi:hypothetical protein